MAAPPPAPRADEPAFPASPESAAPPVVMPASFAPPPGRKALDRSSILNTVIPFVPIVIAILAATGVSYYVTHRSPRAAVHTMDAQPPRPAVDVGSTSPDFTLRDAHGDGKVTLSQVLDTRPVLLVYYLGYSCPRCVANLQELTDRKADFDKLGVQIIAVGPDTVANLRDSLERYSDFPFPMLSDPDQKVARAFGLLYGPPDDEEMLHGLFIIDTQRKVQFAMKSSHPYDNIDTLLSVCRSIQPQSH